MSKQLSVSQFAQIALGTTAYPLHLGNLLKIYNQTILPLGGTLTNLSEAQAFMFVMMLSRLGGMLSIGSTPSAVQSTFSRLRSSVETGESEYWSNGWSFWASSWLNAWSPSAWTTQAFAQLAKLLEPVDGGIFYLSPETSVTLPNPTSPGATVVNTQQAWTVIGIVATFGGLANLGGQILPFWPNTWSDEQWSSVQNVFTSDNAILLAPAQIVPALWQAETATTWAQVNALPAMNMFLFSGS